MFPFRNITGILCIHQAALACGHLIRHVNEYTLLLVGSNLAPVLPSTLNVGPALSFQNQRPLAHRALDNNAGFESAVVYCMIDLFESYIFWAVCL